MNPRVIGACCGRSDPQAPLLKTLTFAILHFSIAFGVAYTLTGSVLTGGLIALIEPSCNTVAFYFHERVWQRFVPGRAGRADTATAIWCRRNAATEPARFEGDESRHRAQQAGGSRSDEGLACP